MSDHTVKGRDVIVDSLSKAMKTANYIRVQCRVCHGVLRVDKLPQYVRLNCSKMGHLRGHGA